jgi:hypothetical protein
LKKFSSWIAKDSIQQSELFVGTDSDERDLLEEEQL